MNWLTSPWPFYCGFPFFIAAPLVLTWYFGRDPDTGKTYHQSAAENSTQTFDDIRSRLQQLLKSGFDQGFVVFRFADSDRFIKYQKYIHAKGDYGIELSFPNTEWSREFFPLAVECCDRLCIAYTIGPRARADSIHFLHADVGQDIDTAFQLVCCIVDDIFEMPRDTEYTLEWDGVDATGGHIDSPSLSPQNREQQYGKEFFKTAGFYMSDIPVALIWLLAFIISVGGMIYALLWWLIWTIASVKADWGVVEGSIAGLEFAVRRFQLLAVITFLGSFLLWRTPAFRRIRQSIREKTNDRNASRAWWQKVNMPLLAAALVVPATVATWVRW